MATTTTICNSFKDELGKSIHNLETDVLKVALFPSVAALTAAVTAYGVGAASAANEVGGASDPNAANVANYPAGGIALGASTLTAAAGNGNIAAWDWPDAVFNGSGSGCTVQNVIYALVYNSSKANRAIMFCTYDAPGKSATAATFTVTIPESGTGALRFG